MLFTLGGSLFASTLLIATPYLGIAFFFAFSSIILDARPCFRAMNWYVYLCFSNYIIGD